jgi:hypothetical protein
MHAPSSVQDPAWLVTTWPDRAGGRPPAFDCVAYKRRNVAERCFNRLEHFRTTAARFDETATSYRGMIGLVTPFVDGTGAAGHDQLGNRRRAADDSGRPYGGGRQARPVHTARRRRGERRIRGGHHRHGRWHRCYAGREGR